jgi:hypothetical protein
MTPPDANKPPASPAAKAAAASPFLIPSAEVAVNLSELRNGNSAKYEKWIGEQLADTGSGDGIAGGDSSEEPRPQG